MVMETDTEVIMMVGEETVTILMPADQDGMLDGTLVAPEDVDHTMDQTITEDGKNNLIFCNFKLFYSL